MPSAPSEQILTGVMNVATLRTWSMLDSDEKIVIEPNLAVPGPTELFYGNRSEVTPKEQLRVQLTYFDKPVAETQPAVATSQEGLSPRAICKILTDDDPERRLHKLEIDHTGLIAYYLDQSGECLRIDIGRGRQPEFNRLRVWAKVQDRSGRLQRSYLYLEKDEPWQFWLYAFDQASRLKWRREYRDLSVLEASRAGHLLHDGWQIEVTEYTY